MRVLILGGTREARLLAEALVMRGVAVTTSLAGRTAGPILPPGELRVGPFGGVAGLVGYLEAARIDRLVDATHPYAITISANAVAAAAASEVPLVRLVRPPWPEPPEAGWRHAATAAEAARVLPPGAHVLLTTGHQGLAAFLQRDDCRFLVRLIEPPAIALPRYVRLLLARPPFSLDDELTLFEREEISHLVSKNAGGQATAAKLEAARRLAVGVVMIDRPTLPPATEVATVEEALAALHLDVS